MPLVQENQKRGTGRVRSAVRNDRLCTLPYGGGQGEAGEDVRRGAEFLQGIRDDLHRLIFGIEENAYKNRIPVSKPEFLIGIFKTLWLMEVFGDVRPRYLIGFMSETFDLGLAESSIRTIWYDKCGMYDQLRPVLQEFFRNLYRK